MKDQKKHVIISICSIIVGNQIQDLLRSVPKQAKEEAPGVELNESTQSAASPVDTKQAAANKDACSLRAVAGKALGTLFLAYVVWRLFGHNTQQDEA